VPIPLPTTVPGSGEVQVVPTLYKELDQKNGFRYAGNTNAPGQPNRTFANPPSELLADPRISTTGNVQYFDLKSAYLACYLYAAGAIQPPVDFTITVIGTKTSGETVSAAFENKSGPMRQFFLPSTFTKLKPVLFRRSFGIVGSATTYTTFETWYTMSTRLAR
jgi:hypothetical protein